MTPGKLPCDIGRRVSYPASDIPGVVDNRAGRAAARRVDPALSILGSTLGLWLTLFAIWL